MKKLLITLLISTSLVIFADDHDEPNYSKFQANYFFNCPNEPACGAAFDKLMKSPEIAKENFNQGGRVGFDEGSKRSKISACW